MENNSDKVMLKINFKKFCLHVEHFINAVYYSISKKHEKAIEEFTEAIKLNAQYPPAYKFRGRSFMEIENFHKAVTDFSQYLKLDDLDPIVYCLRSMCYIELSQYEKAISDLNRAIEIKEDYAAAYFYRVLCHEYSGHALEAKKDYLKASELNPNDQAFNKLARFRKK